MKRTISIIGDCLGFTLIEMLLVLAIIGLMLTVAVPFFRGSSQRAKLKGAIFNTVSLLNYAKMLAIKDNKWVKVETTNNVCIKMFEKQGSSWVNTDKHYCLSAGVKFSSFNNVVFLPSGEAKNTSCFTIQDSLSHKKNVCASELSGKIYLK